jgi:formate dehydrogenase subunit gamma
MRSTTEPDVRVERNNRRTRWFHAGVYVTVLALIATGGWLWIGQEGTPSVLAELTGIADTELHTYLGWALAGIAGLGVVLGWRAALALVRDSLRYRRADLFWFAMPTCVSSRLTVF